MRETLRRPTIKLGVGIAVDLVLFLFPYDSEQTGVSRSLWIGFACWVAGTAVAVWVIWNLPFVLLKLLRLARGLVALTFVAVLWLLALGPVRSAYRDRGTPGARTTQVAQSSQPKHADVSLVPRSAAARVGASIRCANPAERSAPHVS